MWALECNFGPYLRTPGIVLDFQPENGFYQTVNLDSRKVMQVLEYYFVPYLRTPEIVLDSQLENGFYWIVNLYAGNILRVLGITFGRSKIDTRMDFEFSSQEHKLHERFNIQMPKTSCKHPN